ncbi:unnamed protein product [Rotaria sordida]|uniref:Uncharacterized protein n=1 Tax=Rotaria sordida TaxID=392033 RepID=A0A818YR17_9BILA|nr:unnamed protein product [Rotaria sordida]CAF3758252.1 unnamed protein product [Rotaria sordida]
MGNICANTLAEDITQTIVTGSHSDSVPDGSDINDNDSGNAANLALAVALVQTSIYTKSKYHVHLIMYLKYMIGQIITNSTFANTIPNRNGSDYASFLAADDPYCIQNVAQGPCYHKSYDMKR